MIGSDGAFVAVRSPESVRIVLFEIGNVVDLAAGSMRPEPQEIKQTDVPRFLAVSRKGDPSESVYLRDGIAGEIVIA